MSDEQLNTGREEAQQPDILVGKDGKKYGGSSFNDGEGKPELPEGEALAEVFYDVTIPEEDKGFREFQRLFVRKSSIIKTVVLLLVFAVFCAQQIAGKGGETLNWIAMTISAAAVVIVWYNPVSVRKSLMKALEAVKDDRYIFRLYEDAFSIETIIPEEEFEEGEERIYPIPRVVKLAQADFLLSELEDMFVVIMKKETIYVLPKRCMTQQDMDVIRKKLSAEKARS